MPNDPNGHATHTHTHTADGIDQSINHGCLEWPMY